MTTIYGMEPPPDPWHGVPCHSTSVMDYLRSLSSALTKGAGPLSNYEIGSEVELYHGQSIWKLYEGTSHVCPSLLTLA